MINSSNYSAGDSGLNKDNLKNPDNLNNIDYHKILTISNWFKEINLLSQTI